MTPLHRLIWLALLCVVALPARAADRLAVLELTGEDASAAVLLQLSDKLRSGALQAAQTADLDLEIMTRESMAAILGDMGVDATCVEGQCEVETARNLQAAYVISGSLVRLEGQYIVTTKLHGAASGSLLATDEAMSATLLQLRAAVHAMGTALLVKGLKLAPAPTVSPASGSQAQISTNFGAIGAGLDVAARLREQQCDEQAKTMGEAIRGERLRRAEQQALSEADRSWASLKPNLQLCTELRREARDDCIAATTQWIDAAQSMQVTLPASVETVATDCGKRSPAYPALTSSVIAAQVGTAEALLARLRRPNPETADPTAANTASDPTTCDVTVELEMMANAGKLGATNRRCLEAKLANPSLGGVLGQLSARRVRTVLLIDARARGAYSVWTRLIRDAGCEVEAAYECVGHRWRD